jgi:hypothetical protein
MRIRIPPYLPFLILFFFFFNSNILPDGMGAVTGGGDESDGDKDTSRPTKRVKTYPMEDLGITRRMKGEGYKKARKVGEKGR